MTKNNDQQFVALMARLTEDDRAIIQQKMQAIERDVYNRIERAKRADEVEQEIRRGEMRIQNDLAEERSYQDRERQARLDQAQDSNYRW